MKVILLQDVAKIGQRFEVVDVPDGHARNMLLPRKMAEPAVAANLKRLEARKASLDSKRAADDAALAATCAKLEGATIVISAKANEEGHLFKSIKENDIAEAVRAQAGEIGEAHIRLESPIKQTGTYSVEAGTGETRCTFTLNVGAE
jgi:large subunit ribosomal protein L9